MKRQFRDAMEGYSQVQLAYRHKCTERIQRQLEISEHAQLALIVL